MKIGDGDGVIVTHVQIMGSAVHVPFERVEGSIPFPCAGICYNSTLLTSNLNVKYYIARIPKRMGLRKVP
jgi:hypothetical protein